MQVTLAPLEGRELKSLLAFLVMGKVAFDLRPVNGATMVAWAGDARLTVATAGEQIIEAEAEAIF